MPSQYSITIDMSFDSELEMFQMEEKVYDACKLIFDNFENIHVKITKDLTVMVDDYQKTTSEYSIKSVNIDENKYDF